MLATDGQPDMESDRSRVQVIDKAVELLSALAAAPKALPVAELAASARVNRSTAYRILGTLEAHRLVVRTGEQKYRLGMRLFELGCKVTEHDLPFNGPAIAHLRSAAEALKLTGFMCVRDRDRALYIEQAVYGGIQYVPYPAGTSLPLHTGAASRVLLAFASDDDIDRILNRGLERLTAMTTTSPTVLRQQLHAIREAGFAESHDDVTLGISAIGFPVVSGRGDVIAAVSLSGLSSRIFGPEQPQITDAIRRVATLISREIGWDGRTPRRLSPILHI
jgi:DNA-binding IclR family transcriptional regulator